MPPATPRNPTRFLLILLSVAMLWCGGCFSVAISPAGLDEPVAVYFVKYNIHSTVLMPADGKYLDYSFGDWDFAARNHKFPNDALGALVMSFNSTLERRILPIDPRTGGPVIPDNPALVIRLFASRELVRQRLAELQARFDRDMALHANDGGITHVSENLIFVKDPEHYSFFNNCNHLTAATLRALSFDVEGPVFSNNFHIEETRVLDEPRPVGQTFPSP
jgi:hypothetical protein